ncbi:MAG: hypothetical protein K0Q73_7548 [Paenibacillus sp.]|nr:hypothetical protein [Paenibacillus sp.]
MNQSSANEWINRLHFDFSPTLEFLNAMAMVALKQNIIKVSSEMNFKPDAECLEIVEKMESQLSLFLLQELKLLYGDDMFKPNLDFILTRIFLNQLSLSSVNEFIQYLVQIQESELFAPIVHRVYGSQWQDLIGERDWSQLKNQISSMLELVLEAGPPSSSESIELYEKLLECLKHPEEAKRRVVYVVSQFYQLAYKPFEERLTVLSSEGVEKYKRYAAEQDEAFIQRIFKMDSKAIDRETMVYVSYIAQARMSYNRESRESYPDLICIGINNDILADHGRVKEKVENFLKAISDKRRLDIIDLLLERQWYGQELAAKLGLTPAAINYHMNLMFELDFVKLERVENRLYYALDKSRMRNYFSLAMRTILRD